LSRDPIEERGNLNLYEYAGVEPSRYVDPYGRDIWDVEINALQALAGISDKLTFGVTKWARQVLNTDYADPCSKAYKNGELAGDVYSVISGAAELRGAVRAIKADERIAGLVFKNNRWYGGQRGAISSTQVETWTDELNEGIEGLFLETAKSIAELDKSLAGGESGEKCGCHE
jgi:hypothetical protein